MEIHKNWENLFKVRVNNPSDAFVKHEVVKLLVVKNLMLKYQKKKQYQIIYTEHKFPGKTCDVLHYNELTKEIICYEIQSGVTKKWLKETLAIYDKLGIHWELIRLDDLSENLKELDKQVKELVC